MSTSRWSGIFAIGLVVGGALSVFAMVWVVGLNYCPNAPCYYNGDSTDNPENNEYWVPFATGPDTTSSFEPEDSKGNPKYYDRQDLRAQETMARATNAIVWLTGISIVLGAIGAAAIIWTLIETRVLAESTREIGESQVRAYLTIQSCSIRYDAKNNAIGFSFDIKNTGNSPAINPRLKIIAQFIYVDEIGGQLEEDISCGDVPGGEIATIGKIFGDPEIIKKTSFYYGRDDILLRVTVAIIATDVFNKKIMTNRLFAMHGKAISPDIDKTNLIPIDNIADYEKK